jgi:hypothetical protein
VGTVAGPKISLAAFSVTTKRGCLGRSDVAAPFSVTPNTTTPTKCFSLIRVYCTNNTSKLLTKEHLHSHRHINSSSEGEIGSGETMNTQMLMESKRKAFNAGAQALQLERGKGRMQEPVRRWIGAEQQLGAADYGSGLGRWRNRNDSAWRYQALCGLQAQWQDQVGTGIRPWRRGIAGSEAGRRQRRQRWTAVGSAPHPPRYIRTPDEPPGLPPPETVRTASQDEELTAAGELACLPRF